NPNALAIDASGDLYVAASGVGYLGRGVSKFAPGSTSPSAILSLVIPYTSPSGLAVDSHGNLYIAANTNFLGLYNYGAVVEYSNRALTAPATGAFASKDVGNNITVTVSGLVLTGAEAVDYALIQPTTTANISPAALTLTAA